MQGSRSPHPRLNKSCRMVLHALEEQNQLISAQETYEWLKANYPVEAPGLTTVYRALETLLFMDLVQPVDLGDGERRYEWVEQGKHHHHLICTNCKSSVHLEQCFVEALEQGVKDRHGFLVRAHVLEIFGLCSNCLQK